MVEEFLSLKEILCVTFERGDQEGVLQTRSRKSIIKWKKGGMY
jgi:hypothetical protein